MSQPFPRTLSLPPITLTRPQLAIIELINNDKGIDDPTKDARQACLGVLTSERTKLLNLINSFSVGSGVGDISASLQILGPLTYDQVSGLSGPLNNVISNITTKYKDHSERLSGIKEIPPTDETPDFTTVIGVATSHHEAQASFARSKGEIVQDNFSPLFNSIVGDANDEFARVKEQTFDLMGRLENEGTNYLTTVTGVLNEAADNFDGTGNANSFATKDVNNFDNALEFLNKISRASFFVGLAGSKNTHERFLVDNFIGDVNLRTLLSEADNEEDARLTFE